MEEVKENNSKRKGLLIVGIVLLLLIVIFLLWWFNRKFDVTLKYNNGSDDSNLVIKYLNKIDKEDVKEDLTREGYYFAGYYETYYLSGKEIEKIKNNSNNEETICKEDFKLDSDKIKCVSEVPFNFIDTKIKKDTIIEALWSMISEEPQPIEEQPIYEEQPVEQTPVPQPTDNGRISLSANDQCIIGSDRVTIKASLSNNPIDKTITWNSVECFTLEGSDTEKTFRFNGGNICTYKPVVSVRLNNGSSDSLEFTYESSLNVEVYDNGTQIQPRSNGEYYGNNITIKTNVSANFSGSYIRTSSDNSATLNSTSDTTVNITTQCGQTKSVKVNAIIN